VAKARLSCSTYMLYLGIEGPMPGMPRGRHAAVGVAGVLDVDRGLHRQHPVGDLADVAGVILRVVINGDFAKVVPELVPEARRPRWRDAKVAKARLYLGIGPSMPR
jgi:hypothetical protein